MDKSISDLTARELQIYDSLKGIDRLRFARSVGLTTEPTGNDYPKAKMIVPGEDWTDEMRAEHEQKLQQLKGMFGISKLEKMRTLGLIE